MTSFFFIEDKVVTQGSILPIHILWMNNKKWILDPYPNNINSLSELLVFENKPIDHLLGDPDQWKWKMIAAQGILDKQIPFF